MVLGAGLKCVFVPIASRIKKRLGHVETEEFQLTFSGFYTARSPPLAKFRTGWVEELAADGNEEQKLS
jgi:hypothetical protein